MTYPVSSIWPFSLRTNRNRIPWTIRRTAGPSSPVISLDNLKSQLRVTHSTEDELIAEYALAADEALEDELSIALLTQSWELRLDAFPSREIPIPRPLLTDVSSVQYLDTNGVLQILSPSVYVVDTTMKPGRIYLAADQTWPPTQSTVPNTVIISYNAGYAIADDVPALIRAAIRLVVGDLFENRERTAEVAVHDLPTYDRLITNHRCVHEFNYQ